MDRRSFLLAPLGFTGGRCLVPECLAQDADDALLERFGYSLAGNARTGFDPESGTVTLGEGLLGGTPGGGVIGFKEIGIKGWQACRLRYFVEFSPEFPFRLGTGAHRALGGKLPGIVGGKFGSFSARFRPDGSNGFAARPLFMNGDASDVGGTNLYVWDMKADQWGRGPHGITRGVFVPGRRHKVEFDVVLNTPPKADGIIRLRVDGVLLLEMLDFQARLDDSMTLTGCSFAVFFGGGTPDWAPYRDAWVRISGMSAEMLQAG